MKIFDPPTSEAGRDQWEAYLAELSPVSDSEEFDRTVEFIKMRFNEGFDLKNLLPDP